MQKALGGYFGIFWSEGVDQLTTPYLNIIIIVTAFQLFFPVMKGIVKFLHRDFWNDWLAGEESSEGFPAKYYYFMVSLFLVIFCLREK